MSKAKKKSQSPDQTANPQSDDVRTEATRPLQVYAGPCPRAASHTATRVYRTVGRTRYCVCDDCGERFKRIGPPAGEEAAAQPAEV